MPITAPVRHVGAPPEPRTDTACKILVIDADPQLRADLEKVLETNAGTGARKRAAVSGRITADCSYQIDHATRGAEGIARVLTGQAADASYAVACVDVCLPSGLEGLDTTEQLLTLDRDLQVLICAADLDDWRDRLDQRLGMTDRVLILRKPFEALELRQLVYSLARKWQVLRKASAPAHAKRPPTAQDDVLKRRPAQRRPGFGRRPPAEPDSRRIEALMQLTGRLAHELSNPLSCVMTNLEVARERVAALQLSAATAEVLHGALEDASSSAERLRRIADDVGAFSRTDCEEPAVPIDVAAAINAATTAIDRRERRGAAVVSSLAPVPSVVGIRSRLQLALTNLLLNAYQSFDDDGVKHLVQISASRAEDGRVEIRVTDDGRGIPKNNLPRIFEPFFTTRPVGATTGLGLSISRGVVDAMGGAIQVDSVAGRGTTVQLLLPTDASQAPATPERKTRGTQENQPRSARVLLVDDDPAVLRMLERVLVRHQVRSTTKPLTALDLCRDGAFDVVLCDLAMPDMDGAELFSRIRQLRPGFERRIVFVTGGATTEATRRFLDEIDNQVLSKPFNLMELNRIISAQLDALDRPLATRPAGGPEQPASPTPTDS